MKWLDPKFIPWLFEFSKIVVIWNIYRGIFSSHYDAIKAVDLMQNLILSKQYILPNLPNPFARNIFHNPLMSLILNILSPSQYPTFYSSSKLSQKRPWKNLIKGVTSFAILGKVILEKMTSSDP